MKVFLAIAALAILLVGCTGTTADVKLTVVNESASTLTNIVAAGDGFSASIGTLEPGAQATVTNPRPNDGAEFTLDYDADGKHFSEPMSKNPWKGFKGIIMTVTPDFSMDIGSITIF